jgi:hypothetical protein
MGDQISQPLIVGSEQHIAANEAHQSMMSGSAAGRFCRVESRNLFIIVDLDHMIEIVMDSLVLLSRNLSAYSPLQSNVAYVTFVTTVQRDPDGSTSSKDYRSRHCVFSAWCSLAALWRRVGASNTSSKAIDLDIESHSEFTSVSPHKELSEI